MNAEFLFLACIKATIVAATALLAVHLLPQTWLSARRRLAVASVWALALLPWVSLSLPETVPSLLPIPLTEIPSPAWLPIAAGILWLTGTAAKLIRLALEFLHLSALVRRSQRIENGVHIAHGITGPCMWGWLRPLILMPPEALAWPPSQWQAAVLHERQHLRQNDGCHRAIAAILRALFWWHPLVHRLCRRMEIESELCCDAAASAPTSRRAYGEMLLTMAVQASFDTAPAMATGSVRERLQRLLAPAPCTQFSGSLRVGIVATVLITGLIIGCCVDLKKTPAWQASLRTEAALRLSADPFPVR